MKLTKSYLNWATVFFLTLGAVVWLGLMSFSGMYVLWPSVGLAITSLVLSVLYEGEIFKKNIQKALDKLFNTHLFKEKIADEALEELLQCEEIVTKSLFLKTFQTALNHHDHKRQQLMKRWLGRLLTQSKPEEAQRPIEKETLMLITQHSQKNWTQKIKQLQQRHQWLIAFSTLASLLSMVCTSYLMIEALEVIPFLTISAASIPYIVLPIAVISGVAYGLLTYNSCSDFLLDHSINIWWNNFNSLFHQGRERSYLISSGFILLLNLSLTICTAGTWWTLISEHTKGKTTWLSKLKYLSPVVLGLSALSFNLKNTIDTIKELEPSNENEHPLPIQQPQSNEHFWQSINPFRWLLTVTYKPLEKILFLGHLISIGVTGDRMPGVPPILSTLLGTISEGFEDVHYFFPLGSKEQHDHEHSNLPTLALKICFTPLFLLAAVWHALSSNQSIRSSLNLILEQDKHHHEHHHEEIPCKQWQIEESLMTIEEQHQRLETCTRHSSLISQKKNILSSMQSILEEISKKELNPSSEPLDSENAEERLKNLFKHQCLNQHRFWQSAEPTETRQALDEIQPFISAITQGV
jgi:hypothetical protein